MNRDERLIRLKIIERYGHVILIILAGIALITLIISLIYTTWYKP